MASSSKVAFNILNIWREIDLVFIVLFSVFIKSHRTLETF